MASNIQNHFSFGKFGEMSAHTPAAARRQGLLETFRAWRERRAAEAELQALSDRDLADIGISRYDIREAVRADRAYR
ncbi:MAG TPA: DUF1127 domain-containing protein [Acidocella sp.]|nr:MAG: hypothetical protein B7Z81_09430 [Acidocella sp. 20-61-6]HQT47543.1 DUF1127 domain-containing protein [Acidocella sp.]